MRMPRTGGAKVRSTLTARATGPGPYAPRTVGQRGTPVHGPRPLAAQDAPKQGADLPQGACQEPLHPPGVEVEENPDEHRYLYHAGADYGTPEGAGPAGGWRSGPPLSPAGPCPGGSTPRHEATVPTRRHCSPAGTGPPPALPFVPQSRLSSGRHQDHAPTLQERAGTRRAS